MVLCPSVSLPHTLLQVYKCLDTVWGSREAVGQLSTSVVGVNEVVTRLRASGRNGAADQLDATVTALLTSVVQNLDSLAHQVIFTAVDEVIHHTV